jgi:hypothetical protein
MRPPIATSGASSIVPTTRHTTSHPTRHPTPHPLRRTLRTAAASAVATGLVLATIIGTSIATAAPAAAGSRTLHGAFVRPASDVEDFAQLTGSELDLVTGFLPESSWSEITDPYPMNRWKGKGYRMHWSVPLLPSSGASLRTGATGAYDEHFRAVARNLVAAGQSDAIVRLGWEMNCDCQTWSAKKDPASYVAFWRTTVSAMRSVQGADFTFLWAPGSGNSLGTFDTDRAYPGDAWVDAVGASLYDHSESFSADDDAARWGHFYDQDYGLKWLADFGEQHGKPLALAEWGLSSLSSGWGGGDDTYFIQKVYDHVAAHDVLFESYFNYDPSSSERHRITGSTFPQAKALYGKLWGQGYVVRKVAATSGSRATPADVLKFTTTSDGSGTSYALSGAKVNGLVYLEADLTASEAKKVEFFLDDSTSGTPVHTESDPPFWFDGVSAISGRPNPLDGTTLTPGTHRISAVITNWKGSKRTVSSTFTTAG